MSWPLVVLSQDERVCAVSRVCQEQFGLVEQALLGMPADALVAHPAGLHDLLEQACTTEVAQARLPLRAAPAGLAEAEFQARRVGLPDATYTVLLLAAPSFERARSQLLAGCVRLTGSLLAAQSPEQLGALLGHALERLGALCLLALGGTAGAAPQTVYVAPPLVLGEQRQPIWPEQDVVAELPRDTEPRWLPDLGVVLFQTPLPDFYEDAVLRLRLCGISGAVCAPLHHDAPDAGMLVIWSPLLGPDDLALVAALAGQVGACLQQIAARQRDQRQISQFRRLSATTRAVADLGMTDDVLSEICRQAKPLLEADSAAVALCYDEASCVIAMTSEHMTDWVIGQRLPINGSLSGAVLRSGQGRCIVDVAREARAHPISRRGKSRAVLMVPLIHQDRALGLLVAGHQQPGRFTNDDLTLLERFAESAAVALANAQFHSALQHSEQRYRLLFEQSADMVISLSPEGAVLRANQAALNLLNLPHAQVQSAILADLMSEAIAAQLNKFIAELLQRAQPIPWVMHTERRAGGRLVLEITGHVLWQDEQPLEVELIGRDVTSRHEAAEEQERQHRELAALLRVSEAINQSLDLDTILDAGLQAVHELKLADMSGVSLLSSDGEFLELRASAHVLASPQQRVRDRRVPVDQQPFESAALRSGQTQIIDAAQFAAVYGRHIRNTDLANASMVIVPLLANGRPLGTLHLSRLTGQVYSPRDLQVLQAVAGQLAQALERAQVHLDLGETAQANARLYREAEEVRSYLNTLINSTPDALIVLALDMTIRPLNPERLAAITGYSQADVIGKPFTRFVPAHRQADVLTQWQVALTGDPLIFEMDLERADGTLLTALISAVRIPAYEEVFVIIKDVTQPRQLEEQVRRTEKLAALGRLVAGVAHELNNPLAVILGLAQLQLLDDLPPSTRIDVEGIEQAALRAGAIVRQLRAFARPQLTRRQAIDVEAVVADVLDRLSGEISARQIELQTHLRSAAALIDGDLQQVDQVLFNVIYNAIQALMALPAGQPRRLTIKTWNIGHGLRLTVTDNGPGIAPAHLPHIFEPFFTTRAVGQGAGLGLAIVHAVIQQHGGQVWAESVPNRATIFHLELPLAAATLRHSPEAERLAGLSIGVRVLLVEGDPGVQIVVARALGGAGLSVDTVGSAEAALELVQSGEYGLVISDLQLPGLDGPALYERISRQRPALNWLILTGDVQGERGQAFLARSGLPVLLKPFTREQLLEAVAHRLSPG